MNAKFLKAIVVMSSIFLLNPAYSAGAEKIPFVGSKSFSFGGVPAFNETYTAHINKVGLITIIYTACYSQNCDDGEIIYKGHYQPIIALNHDNRLYHVKLTKKKAYLLDEKKKQAVGCDTLNGGSQTEPCVSNYY